MDDAARRRELRRIARRHHPDLGGDPRAYLDAVEALDRIQPGSRRAYGPRVDVRRRRGLSSLLHLLARRWRSRRASKRDARRSRTEAALRSRREQPVPGRRW